MSEIETKLRPEPDPVLAEKVQQVVGLWKLSAGLRTVPAIEVLESNIAGAIASSCEEVRRAVRTPIWHQVDPRGWEWDVWRDGILLAMIRALPDGFKVIHRNSPDKEFSDLGDSIAWVALQMSRGGVLDMSVRSPEAVTDEMRQAACRALNERGQGNAITIADVNAMLAAALAGGSNVPA